MKMLLFPVACLTVMSALSACYPNAAVGPERGPHTQNTVQPSAYDNRMHHYNHYTQRYDAYNNRDGFTAQGFNQELAERIARAADSVPGVDRATAVVYGNDAVVGVQTRISGTDPQRRQVVEQKVHTAVRAVAPHLNIRVTTDGAMLTRIRSMNDAARNGMTNTKNAVTSGPTNVAGNLSNAANDFSALLRDLGRTITAPFR
jgi:YhcN/YlaJ family sporulation lipoprotein